MAAAGSRRSETVGDLLLSEVGVLLRDSEEDQRSFGQVKAPPQKRRAVIRVESAETQDYVSALPLTSCMEQKMEAEDEKNMSFVSSAVREPRWASICFVTSVQQRASNSSKLRLVCQKKEAQRTRLTFTGSATMNGD